MLVAGECRYVQTAAKQSTWFVARERQVKLIKAAFDMCVFEAYLARSSQRTRGVSAGVTSQGSRGLEFDNESARHGSCVARSTAAFPVAEHRRCCTSTRLYS